MDNFCGFTEIKKKKIILPISETLKYLENSNNNMANEWNLNNLSFDIERQKNTTMLDVLNYHTFMFALNKSISKETKDSNLVSKIYKIIFKLTYFIKCYNNCNK